MRLTAICIGWMIAFGTLQSAGAVEPTKQDEQTLAQELKETKQLVEKLSAQIEKLEQQLEKTQPTEKAQPVEKPVLVTNAYKVADLAAMRELGADAVANMDYLIDYITTNIAPDQWQKAGGPATIAPYRANLSLVISAPREVHQKINEQLAKLREARKIREAMKVLDDFYRTKSKVSAAY